MFHQGPRVKIKLEDYILDAYLNSHNIISSISCLTQLKNIGQISDKILKRIKD